MTVLSCLNSIYSALIGIIQEPLICLVKSLMIYSHFLLYSISFLYLDFFLHKFVGMNIVLKRHMGFYMLQVYVPCIMLVILSWVSFFINREATSDRSNIGELEKQINYTSILVLQL